MKTQWTLQEPEAIKDYLHGETPAHQAKACCYFEYARQSEVWRKARQGFDPRNAISLNEFLHTVALGFEEDSCTLLRDWTGLEILICDGFPELSWRALRATQKEAICAHFAGQRVDGFPQRNRRIKRIRLSASRLIRLFRSITTRAEDPLY